MAKLKKKTTKKQSVKKKAVKKKGAKKKAAKKTTKKKLTQKQALFVQEYLIDLNATQAAIRAGYSKKTAKEIGYENFTKPYIKAAVDEALAGRSERTKIDADYVLQKAVELLETSVSSFLVAENSESMPYFDLSKATPEQLAAIDTLQLDTSREKTGEHDDKGKPETVIVRKIKLGLPKKKDLLELIGKHVNVQAFKDNAASVGLTVILNSKDSQA